MQLKEVLHNRFMPLSESELEQVWHWRNLPHIRANMHNDRLISWPEHQAWFKQLQQDNQKTYLVLWQNNRPIGTLYFTLIADATLEWGCYIGDQQVWPGSGLLLEIAALDYAARCHSILTLQAEVLSFNHSVIKIHTLFDYQLINQGNYVGVRNNQAYKVMTFNYQLANWRENRSNILAKLPKQIVAAANLIEFKQQ